MKRKSYVVESKRPEALQWAERYIVGHVDSAEFALKSCINMDRTLGVLISYRIVERVETVLKQVTPNAETDNVNEA